MRSRHIAAPRRRFAAVLRFYVLPLTLLALACDDDASATNPDAGVRSACDGGNCRTARPDAGVASAHPDGGCEPTGPSRAELGSALETVDLGFDADQILSTAEGLYLASVSTAVLKGGLYWLPTGAEIPKLVVADFAGTDLVANSTFLAWYDYEYHPIPGREEGSEKGSVWAIALGSEHVTPVMLIDDPEAHFMHTALGETHGYAWDAVSEAIYAFPLNGAASTTLGHAESVLQMIGDGDDLFYTSQITLAQTISRVTASGGPAEILLTSQSHFNLFALDQDALYTATERQLVRYERADPTRSKTIMRLPTLNSGGTDEAMFLAVVDDRLVFTDLANNIGWVKTDGSECGLFVTAFSPRSDEPLDTIAFDRDYLYVRDYPLAHSSRPSIPPVLYRISRAAIGF